MRKEKNDVSRNIDMLTFEIEYNLNLKIFFYVYTDSI